MNTRSVRLIGLAAIILMSILVIAGFYGLNTLRTVAQQTATTFTGKSVDLIDTRHGHLTLVSFWASSCKPCIKEMPDFIRLYHDYNPSPRRPLNIIGITMPFDQADMTLAILNHFNIPWPNIPDPQGRLASAFGNINAVPTTLLLDHTGQITWKHEGPVDFARLRHLIHKNLTQGS